MKKYLLLLIVGLAMLIPTAAIAKKKQASIRFLETSYNFGTIPDNGGKVSHSFEFINDGDANLVILDASADCGCTVPEFPNAPIAPGKKGKIKVTFDPKYREGSFDKVVTVRSNAKQKKARVKVSGVISTK